MMAATRSQADYEALVEAHRGLAVTTARMISQRVPPVAGLDLGDFVAAANLGLCRAARQFDPARKVQFTSYAISMMRGAVLEQLRDWDWLSRTARAKIRAGLAQAVEYPCSLQSCPAATPEGDTLLDLMFDEAPGPEELAMEACQRSELLAAVERLPERERFAITEYFQHGGTHRAIGAALGISESRAYQLHQAGLERLRLWLKDGSETV